MTATRADAPPPERQAPRLPQRRGVELSLLLCAVLISVFGYVAVGLGKDHAVPPDALGYGAGLGVLALLAHLAVRLRAPYADPLLLPIAVLLNGLGLVLIYRLDLETPGDRAAPTQLVWSTLGVALFIAAVVFLRDHRVLARYAYICVATALLLLVVPIAFPAVNGAKIWIRFGGFSFQPGEFAKVLLAVFFAAYLAANRNALTYTGRRFQLPRGRVLGPLVAIWLLSVMVLVVERDLGTSLLFFGLFVVMLYVATGRTGWIAAGLLLAAVGAFAVGSLEPHVHSRVQDWLDPFASIAAGRGPGQLAQSLFAFAAGGLLGTGLGLGRSILIGFAAKSDFILATAGEELGLVGLTALFLLYALLVARGFRAGLALRDPFGRLLAIGLSSILGLQVFVIAGGVMGLIPLTGMAMPFLAQGGSSVVTNWIIIALLMRLSDSARGPDGGPGPVPGATAAPTATATAFVGPPMTRCIRRTAVLFLALLAALLVNAARIQVLDADSLDHNPANRRDTAARYSQQRGDILVDGRAVTGSRDSGQHLRYERTYRHGPLYAPVTGYASQTYGTTLLEDAEDPILSGTSPMLAPFPFWNDLTRGRRPGGSVATTVKASVQRAAYEGLAGRRGAVAAVEPFSGRILALVSSPSYDPGLLSGTGPGVTDAWARLTGGSTQPMLDRAIRGTYPPGSTFKIVTAAAALDSGTVEDPDAPTDIAEPYVLPGTGTTLPNEAEGCDRASLAYAIRWSCNTVMAGLGVATGLDGMLDTVRKFGFNDAGIRIPSRVAASNFDTRMSDDELALSSIGQFDTRATPLQMAMVASAVANGGDLKYPYLVDRTLASDGSVVSRTGQRSYARAMKPLTAQRLRAMMIDAVEDGTGGNAAIDGATVGGKTGTAQHGVDNTGTPYAWFIAWAQSGTSGRPAVAVAVVVEDAEADRADISGGGDAAPIARAVMAAALRDH